MKRKGITIWEQYVERFVLGGAVAFFLVFTALQFLSQPNSVDRGAGGMVSPVEIDGLLAERARALQGRLAPDAIAPFEIPDPSPVLDEFLSAVNGPISPNLHLVTSSRRVVFAGTINPNKGVAYVEPTIGAPRSPVFDQFFDGLDEEIVMQYAALQERLPEAPYDITWITPAALFNLKAVREQFESEPGGLSPIPVSWYRNRIDVLDVKVEREELVDGNWTNNVVLDPLPGQHTYRAELAKADLDKATRDDILREISDPDVQLEILAPAFYPTRHEVWSPPDPDLDVSAEDEAKLTEEELAIHRLEQRIRKKVNERAEKADRFLEIGGKLGGSGKEERKGAGEKKGSSGSGAGKGSGSGGAPPGGRGGGDRRKVGKKRGAPGQGVGTIGAAGPGGGAGNEANEKEKKRLKASIAALDKNIKRLKRDLTKLRTDAGLLDEGDQPAETEETHDEVLLLAHDITIEAGKTYRYRFTVEIYNPFYAKKPHLLDEQDGLADGITLRSEPSAWSAPKTVIPDREIYITRAYGPGERNAGHMGMGQATAEVFRFYDARWWLETFPVEPGDRVGAERAQDFGGDDDGDGVRIDFGTDWFVLDILADMDAETEVVDRGFGARVLLQSLQDSTKVKLSDPRRAATDQERQFLKDAVELAELSGDLALGE